MEILRRVGLELPGPERDVGATEVVETRHRRGHDLPGPPGVGFDEVNRLMNLSRVGVVCGCDDGAPGILT